MAFAENFNIFFADFGVDCVADYQDEDLDDYEFIGIFEDPFAATQIGTYRVIISDPTLLVIETPQINLIKKDDRITVDGRRYIVLGQAKDDGTGISRIPLERDESEAEMGDLLPKEGDGLFT